MKVIVEGIMKEYDSKMHLAKEFVKNYKQILNNFVVDDQEMDFSLVNLTVQFFTVKSIGQTLMEETDVFHVLIDMFAGRLIEHFEEVAQPQWKNCKLWSVFK